MNQIGGGVRHMIHLPDIIVSSVHQELGHGNIICSMGDWAELAFRCPHKARLTVCHHADSARVVIDMLFLHDPVLRAAFSIYRPDFDPYGVAADLVDAIRGIKRWHKNHSERFPVIFGRPYNIDELKEALKE